MHHWRQPSASAYFLPGSTIILFLGAISARGYIDVGDLIWFSAIGAIMGDNINYYLGKRYGAKWVREGFWFLKAQHIEKARHFMDAHGVKSIFLGRFIPSVKWLITSKGRIFFSVVNSLWKSVKQAVQNNEHVVRWLKKTPCRCLFFSETFANVNIFRTAPVHANAGVYLYFGFVGWSHRRPDNI
ncbi:MAG: VTT domain-containing protein [Deltaproteobacteria bacterium]|nr:VTT domain-containing protein [Deltaproteobacteria bacterium]